MKVKTPGKDEASAASAAVIEKPTGPSADPGSSPAASAEPEPVGDDAAEEEPEPESAPEGGQGDQADEPQPEGAARGAFRQLAARVTGAMQDRAQLRERIAELETENEDLRQQLAAALPLADAHRDLEKQVRQLEADQQTVSRGVRAELETIGVAEAEAPAASPADAGETVAEMTARMEAEKDPAKRREIYQQIRQLEKQR